MQSRKNFVSIVNRKADLAAKEAAEQEVADAYASIVKDTVLDHTILIDMQKVQRQMRKRYGVLKG